MKPRTAKAKGPAPTIETQNRSKRDPRVESRDSTIAIPESRLAIRDSGVENRMLYSDVCARVARVYCQEGRRHQDPKQKSKQELQMPLRCLRTKQCQHKQNSFGRRGENPANLPKREKAYRRCVRCANQHCIAVCLQNK